MSLYTLKHIPEVKWSFNRYLGGSILFGFELRNNGAYDMKSSEMCLFLRFIHVTPCGHTFLE